MEDITHYKKRGVSMFLAVAVVMSSCSKESILVDLPDTDLQNAQMLKSSAGSCEDDCIEPGSLFFYPVSDTVTISVGVNTKSVSYKAYNTETDFVVEVTYAITAGPSNAEATITIDIDGDEVEYASVSSGSTVSHTVLLAENWAGCDEVAFSIVQEALGVPITFSESYYLIPVCPEGLKIGDAYQGGIIAYILQPGDPDYVANETHGIIAAPSDQSTAAEWGCTGTLIGTSTALGTGADNTAAIVAGCTTAGIAARICDDLELNDYNDWYLPSKDELNKLYENLAVGVIPYAFYWSSSEYGGYYAWTQYFLNGPQIGYYKGYTRSVRAVRAF